MPGEPLGADDEAAGADDHVKLDQGDDDDEDDHDGEYNNFCSAYQQWLL